MLSPLETVAAARAAPLHLQLRIASVVMAGELARVSGPVVRVFRGASSLVGLAMELELPVVDEAAEASAPDGLAAYLPGGLRAGRVVEAYVEPTPNGYAVVLGLSGVFDEPSEVSQLDEERSPPTGWWTREVLPSGALRFAFTPDEPFLATSTWRGLGVGVLGLAGLVAATSEGKGLLVAVAGVAGLGLFMVAARARPAWQAWVTSAGQATLEEHRGAKVSSVALEPRAVVLVREARGDVKGARLYVEAPTRYAVGPPNFPADEAELLGFDLAQALGVPFVREEKR